MTMTSGDIPKVTVTCPGCARQYRFPAAKLDAKVRCVACRTVFHAGSAASGEPAQAYYAQPSAMPPPPGYPQAQGWPAMPLPPFAVVAPLSAPADRPIFDDQECPSAARTAQQTAPPERVHYDPSAPPPAASGQGVCPICQTPTKGDATTECDDCHALHHQECWDYNHGCGKYGCKSAPATEKLTEMETPVSYWGQTQKACPQCQHPIQATAIRCRYCGTVFGTARPLHRVEFHDQRTQQIDLQSVRKVSILLLVLCIIPFTTPLATPVCAIWYAVKRKRVALLPATHAALPRLALIIGVTQCVLAAVIIGIYSVTAG